MTETTERHTFEARNGTLHVGTPDGAWHIVSKCGRRYAWDGVSYPGAPVTCSRCK